AYLPIPMYLTFITFFFHDTSAPEIYTLSLHDALPIWTRSPCCRSAATTWPTTSGTGSTSAGPPRPASCRGSSTSTGSGGATTARSEEHTSELQSPYDLVCRLLLEKKKKTDNTRKTTNR